MIFIIGIALVVVVWLALALRKSASDTDELYERLYREHVEKKKHEV